MYLKKLHQRTICDPDYPVVNTRYGKLRGMWRDGCYIFRGIEYAKAARFHLPEEPEEWEGIRNALAYGPVPDEISTRIPGDAYTEPHFWYPQSEFCQNLNIWTPQIEQEKTAAQEKLPVMVWIHGGGQEHGSAVEIMAYDGEELARWGKVVVVSVNHRLNVLGYLDLSSFGEEYALSGYAGMMDLVQALRWIRDNIAAFGGDPDNVMLFGQSGGGYKIIELMQMPAADGLYHKAAIHSGTGRDTLFTHENAAPVARDIVSYLGLEADRIHEIESVPYYRLAKAVNYAYDRFRERTGERLQWTPPVDHLHYFGNPQMDGMTFRRETAHIPMLVGSVLGEFTSSAAQNDADGDINTWDGRTIDRKLRETYGDAAGAIAEAFAAAYPGKPAAQASCVDVFMRRPHMDLCRMRAGNDYAPVYNWMLALSMPCYGGSAPWHNADEAYVFHHAEYFESQYIPGVTERVQDQMAGAWVSFARTGNPNDGSDILRGQPGHVCPLWKPVEPDAMHTMIFDEETVLRTGHDEQLIELILQTGATGPGGKGPVRTYGGGPRAHR